MSFITSPQASGDTTASPDWQAIQHEVKCPLCDYNLRGLHEPRCPECGYQFDWPSVLDPSQRRHPYLFEHHPERNVRSFIQTLLRHLRPRDFWTTLHPAHRLRPARIVLYWMIYGLFAFTPAVATLVEVVRYRLQWIRPGRYRSVYVNVTQQTVWSKEGLVVGTAVLLLALFPWFNFLALMIFQQSMKRSRIKGSHVLRCAIYSGDLVAWYAIGASLAIIYLGSRPRSGQAQELAQLLILAAVLTGLLNSLRLWNAYRHYMKFKSALATVIASQLIVALAIFTIIAWVATTT